MEFIKKVNTQSKDNGLRNAGLREDRKKSPNPKRPSIIALLLVILLDILGKIQNINMTANNLTEILLIFLAIMLISVILIQLSKN